MKHYLVQEPPNYSYVMSEEDILNAFFDRWKEMMKKAGREHLISEENCIEDWVTVHWAMEV